MITRLRLAEILAWAGLRFSRFGVWLIRQGTALLDAEIARLDQKTSVLRGKKAQQ
jgi:hypothetical protein